MLAGPRVDRASKYIINGDKIATCGMPCVMGRGEDTAAPF